MTVFYTKEENTLLLQKQAEKLCVEAHKTTLRLTKEAVLVSKEESKKINDELQKLLLP